MKSEKESPMLKPAEPGLFGLVGKYWGMLVVLIFFALLSNGLNLAIPELIAHAIDAYTGSTFVFSTVVWEFSIVAVLVLIFTAIQSVVQVYASERVARDLRTRLAAKISRGTYSYIENTNPSKLLTNLTSDVDSVKNFVAQAIVSLLSSIMIIIGAAVLLLMLDWRLGLAVLVIVPLIGGTFFLIIRQVRSLFAKSREVIDWLNKVINESILGAALIRVLHSKNLESQKFSDANTRAKDLGMQILRLFAIMIPLITFFSNMAMLVILSFGGHLVISGSMTLGDFAAFNNYVVLLIFPVLVIGFMSNVIVQAQASYDRIRFVLQSPDEKPDGTIKEKIRGDISVKNVTVSYGERRALKDVSFNVAAGTRAAVIGPTAAGKTQLLYALTGLIRPTSGTIEYDSRTIEAYDPETLHDQIGFVFQDSIIFNMSLRENIAFNGSVTDESMEKAIDTAELSDFIRALPEGLKTVVSERGASLSGGQKQRIMLARALALNPRVLLLDDFTARVDTNTERKILDNIRRNYPDTTLISVTQKISSIEHYDTIIVLMEGELLASGKHEELLRTSPEYVQIFESQKSTNQYEETK